MNLPRPAPGIPALFETTVKSLISGRSRTALIKLLGTPENPKPPTKIIDEPFRSLIASLALGTFLLIARREVEDENSRRQSGRRTEGPAILAFIMEFMICKIYTKRKKRRKKAAEEKMGLS